MIIEVMITDFNYHIIMKISGIRKTSSMLLISPHKKKIDNNNYEFLRITENQSVPGQ